MPYIPQVDRPRVNSGPPRTVGELTFKLTGVVDRYLGDEPRYADFAEAVAALECSKLELYRRMVAPYEDDKIKENGDAYRRRGQGEDRRQAAPGGTPRSAASAGGLLGPGAGPQPVDGIGG